jgi:hypothetical protein
MSAPTHRCKASDIPVSILRKFGLDLVEIQTPHGNWIMSEASFNSTFFEIEPDDYSDLDDGGITR